MRKFLGLILAGVLALLTACNVSSASETSAARVSDRVSAEQSQQTAEDEATLEELRSSDIYKAMRKLNSNADFETPNVRGAVAYSAAYESANGFETTADGKPDYAALEEKGTCCVGFVNYYLFNYLPNEAGKEMNLTFYNSPDNDDEVVGRILANSTSYTMLQAVKKKNSGWSCTYDAGMEVGKDYSYVTADYESGKLHYEVGDILILSTEQFRYDHVAVYGGYYNGQHWLIHSTAALDNIGVTMSPFNGSYRETEEDGLAYITQVFHFTEEA